MRNSKEVKVNDRLVTVLELTVKVIKALWNDITGISAETKTAPLFTNEKLMMEHWDKCIHGIKINEVDDLSPSELKLVYDAFLEVNDIFFDLALKLEKENPFLMSFREAVVSDLMLRFAALSAKDTETSGNTDTASS